MKRRSTTGKTAGGVMSLEKRKKRGMDSEVNESYFSRGGRKASVVHR